MARILVIFTGGTIGSSVSDGYISNDENKKYKLLEMYRERVDAGLGSELKLDSSSGLGSDASHKGDTETCGVEFDYIEPYSMLSENLTGESISRLCQTVRDVIGAPSFNYDGIIITHGTDTLQYSASALSFVFSDVDIPILLVSSNYVLEDKCANGVDNFMGAVAFIRNKTANGVYISYRNDDGILYFHKGCRALPHRPYSDNIYSVCDRYFAKYDFENDKVEVNPDYREELNLDYKVELNPDYKVELSSDYKESVNPYYREVDIDEINLDNQENAGMADGATQKLRLSLPEKWNSNILRIFPYPGMTYPDLERCALKDYNSNKPDAESSKNADILPKAILLDTYHSGTLCTANPDLDEFLTSANKLNIPVFLTGASKGASYESVKGWEQKNVTVLPVASPIAMYMKLWLLSGVEDTDELVDSMFVNVCGEMVDLL